MLVAFGFRIQGSELQHEPAQTIKGEWAFLDGSNCRKPKDTHTHTHSSADPPTQLGAASLFGYNRLKPMRHDRQPDNPEILNTRSSCTQSRTSNHDAPHA